MKAEDIEVVLDLLNVVLHPEIDHLGLVGLVGHLSLLGPVGNHKMMFPNGVEMLDLEMNAVDLDKHKKQHNSISLSRMNG
jgi:hypothetical protein